MGLDERLFGWLYGRFRQSRNEQPPSGAAIFLEDVQERLEFVASALLGSPVMVRESQGVGGVKGNVLLLPGHIDVCGECESNRLAFLHRVAFAVSSKRLGFSLEGVESNPNLWRIRKDKTSSARTLSPQALCATFLAIPSTVSALKREFPGFAGMADTISTDLGETSLCGIYKGSAFSRAGVELPANQDSLRNAMRNHSEVLSGVLESHWATWTRILPLFGVLRPKEVGEASSVNAENPNGTPASAGATERQAPLRDDVDVVDVGDSEENENPLVHSFEKVHTVDDYSGGSKRHDGEDQLDEQMAALDEIDLSQMVRTNEAAQSVLKLDGWFGGTVGDVVGDDDPEGRLAIRYPEWDRSKRQYRHDWCTLYLENNPPEVDSETIRTRTKQARAVHRNQREEISRILEQIEVERRWQSRQLDGSEFDLDAVVDGRGGLLAGVVPSERVYLQRARHEREMSTLLLLDVSLSSDAWIDNQRMLSVAQNALITLGDVLSRSNDAFAVAGFRSHTRRDCRWLPIKSFDEPWDTAVERMLAIEPAGYTRVGPALRHGIAVLSEQSARRKLLMLVTDGKPTDYDRYEGTYGNDDVRQAFREAEQKGIVPIALAIAQDGRNALSRQFGSDGYRLIRDPSELPRALTSVYSRFVR